ncbi:MAG: APC family permease, partial [Caulobacteraceae bacterium]
MSEGARIAQPVGAGGRGASLERAMPGVGGLLLTLSNITPAASVFVIGSQVIAEAGSGAIWSFVFAAAICVPVAFAYAELSSAFPVAGQEYSLVGKTLGAPFGFAALGLNVLGGAFSQAVTALGLAVYLAIALPGVPVLATAIGATAACTLIGILNIRVNALVTGLFLLCELASLGAIAWLGLSHPARGLGAVLLHPLARSGAGGLVPAPISTIALGAAGAIFAFSGFGSAVSFGEEIVKVRSRIGWVIVLALLLAAVFEVTPILGVVLGAPGLPPLLAKASPVTAFIFEGGALFARLVALGVAIAIFNAMIATSLINARQVFAAGRDRAWPAPLNRFAVLVHPRLKSPWPATLFGGVLTAAMCLMPLQDLVLLTATGLLGTYAMVAAGALRGRLTGASAHAPWRAPAGKAVFLLALAGVLAIAWAEWEDR